MVNNFQTERENINVIIRRGGGGGWYCEYCPSEATLFMRTCLFRAYNIRLDSLIPAKQELLCFSQICGSSRPADRQTDTHTRRNLLILSLYKIRLMVAHVCVHVMRVED